MFFPQEHYIKVGSLNTRYYAEGEGSPLVLIHGAGGSASGWLPILGQLAMKHRVYAPDMPGQGRTDRFPSEPYDLHAYAKFVSDFMAEMKLERAHLAGHSWGGGILLHLAQDFPSRVMKMILIDSLCLGRELLFLYRLASIPILGEILAFFDQARSLKKFSQKVKAGLKDSTAITDEYLKILYEVEQVPPHYPTTLRILRTYTNLLGQKPSVYEPILKSLPSLTNPTLVIWGKQDDVLPIQHGETAARLLPNVRFEPIEDSLHIPLFDYPDRVSRLMLEFLAG